MAIQRNAAVCANFLLMIECCGCGLVTAATAFALGPRPVPLLAGAAELRGACGRTRARGPTCSAGAELRKALKKTTGALTVSLEFDRLESSDCTENDLIVLSMQLRKIKCASLWAAGLGDVKIIRCLPALSCRVPAAAKECAKISTLYSDTLMDIAVCSNEQKSAKGNFPGPCPVVYYPPLSTADKGQIKAAADAGAAAVVLRPDLLSLADAAQALKLEVIWDVRSPEEIAKVVEAEGPNKSPTFLVSGADASAGLMSALPKDALTVASVDAQNDEVALGRSLKDAGVKALVVRQACRGVGSWDLRYGR